MTNSRAERGLDDVDDVIMNDDVDFVEDTDNESSETPMRSRSFNMDMRHRIEDRLEQRRLQKELNEYEFFDIDDTVH